MTSKWVFFPGLHPSLMFRFQTEKVAPRRARTLVAEGSIRSVGLGYRKAPRAFGQSPFDHSGHLIGCRFGGPSRRANIVPMHGLVNMSGGPWYDMEGNIASLIGDGTGTMRVVVRYHETSLLRPIAFHVEARSSSGQVQTWHMPNWSPHLENPHYDPAAAAAEEQELDAAAEALAGEVD